MLFLVFFSDLKLLGEGVGGLEVHIIVPDSHFKLFLCAVVYGQSIADLLHSLGSQDDLIIFLVGLNLGNGCHELPSKDK